jgi:thiamine monophosphate synthase
MMSRQTPEEIFLHNASRIYCFAESVDLCVALLEAGARVIQLRNKTVDAEVIGLEGLSAVVAAVNIPVGAIGGIAKQNIRQVYETGVRYCAVISGINRASDPVAAFRQLEAILSPFPPGKQTKPA